MKIITDERCTSYCHPGHPERPERVRDAVAHLKRQKELPVTWVAAKSADDAAVKRAHSPRHIARLEEPIDFDADTPHFNGIGEYARCSTAAAIQAAHLARAGEMSFSLMRPPGHHATRDQAMGFCYLSAIAIATLDALASGVKRVAVFDFDVHHGNGTEAILVNHHGTAFFSIHQHPCYPGTGAANVGHNCFNFPVAPGTPHREYRAVFSKALDGLKKFKPDLIAVSAGFDAYARDPLAQETLEAEDFHWLGEELRALGTPVFSILEGGYSEDLPGLIFAYLQGLEGK